MSHRRTLGLSLGFALVACAPPRATPPAGAPQPIAADTATNASVVSVRSAPVHHFYASRPWGSEAAFNPVSEIVVDGLDQLRVDWSDRRVLHWPWARAAGHVGYSLRHAEQAYRRYGWGRALRNEILPLTTRRNGGGQWFPNYQFHLLGSGMVTARLAEWYDAHGAPHPYALSATTMMAAHFLNEMTEDGGRDRPNSVDAITDLYLFDVGGILLFRSERVRRLFGERLPLTNWPMQPSLVLPGATLENVGQSYALKAPIPGTRRWHALYVFGIATFVGVTRDVGGGYAVSLAGGADVTRVTVLDTLTQRRTVSLKPNAGLFVDREGSLLLSLMARDGPEVVATANLYPHALPHQPLGLWAQVLRAGGVRAGIASPWGLGAGWR